ncbi:MAG: carbohydrate kinase [Bacteroidetes bacterium MedPE-SWsnd-G1]|nr:MAG: carbohydrate kinase [Bacteroidetes bacterium MedPE-SWsnd-G1]
MKILSTQQIYAADTATIKNQGITSLDLMERAATLCFNWIHEKLKGDPMRILVFCGVGNNGGDGLVIARHLFQHGYNVSCYVLNYSEKRSGAFLENYNRLKEMGEWPTMINSSEEIPEIDSDDLIVDAIFGIGLKRAVSGFTSELIKKINAISPFSLAIDMPSGLYANDPNSDGDIILEATHTLTFQGPKLSFLLPNNAPFISSWEILNIALDEEFLQTLETDYVIITDSLIASVYKDRDQFSHKGTFGHTLIIGGSYGKIGAAVLASRAALKTGSGLVSAYIPKCGYNILQASIPEVMVEVDSENELQHFNFKCNPTVIGIGPGIGTSEKTTKGLINFLKDSSTPMVVDADALNIIALNKELLNYLPKSSVLTPHPKEFERLVGGWKNDYEKLEKLQSFSKENKVIVVLKGKYSVIANGNKLYFNPTGNTALATGGSGDVLTGIITGLIAQGYETFDAAIFGVYLHGLSAEIGMENLTEETFIASDILSYLSNAFREVKN